MRRLAARHQAGQPPGLLVTPPLPPTPTPSGTANFLRQKKKMQTNEMKCAFSQEKKLTEQFIGSCTGTPGKAGADVCGGSSGGVCVWGGT